MFASPTWFIETVQKRGTPRSITLMNLFLHHVGQPEVGDLHAQRVVQQKVLRLQVSETINMLSKSIYSHFIFSIIQCCGSGSVWICFIPASRIQVANNQRKSWIIYPKNQPYHKNFIKKHIT